MVIKTQQNRVSDSINLLTKELLTNYNTEKTKKTLFTAFLSQYKLITYPGEKKELIILFDTETREYSFEFITVHFTPHPLPENNRFVCGKELIISHKEFSFDARTPAIKLLQLAKEKYSRLYKAKARRSRLYKLWEDEPERYSFFFAKEQAVLIQQWLMRLLKKSVDEFIKTLKLEIIQGTNPVKHFLFNKLPANTLSQEETINLLVDAFFLPDLMLYNKKVGYRYHVELRKEGLWRKVRLSMNSFACCLKERDCFLELIKGISDRQNDEYTGASEKGLLVLIHALSELKEDDKVIVNRNLEFILDNDDYKELLRPMVVKAVGSITSVRWSNKDEQTELFIESLKKLFEKDRRVLLKLTELFIEESVKQANYGLVVCLLSILFGDTTEEKQLCFLTEDLLFNKTTTDSYELIMQAITEFKTNSLYKGSVSY